MGRPDGSQGARRFIGQNAGALPARNERRVVQERTGIFFDRLLQHEEQRLDLFAVLEYAGPNTAWNDRIEKEAMPAGRLANPKRALL